MLQLVLAKVKGYVNQIACCYGNM